MHLKLRKDLRKEKFTREDNWNIFPCMRFATTIKGDMKANEDSYGHHRKYAHRLIAVFPPSFE